MIGRQQIIFNSNIISFFRFVNKQNITATQFYQQSNNDVLKNS